MFKNYSEICSLFLNLFQSLFAFFAIKGVHMLIRQLPDQHMK